MIPPMTYAPHTFDDLEPGACFEAGPRRVSREDISRFAELSGDHMALHTDEAYAATTPLGGACRRFWMVAKSAPSETAASALRLRRA